MLNIGILGGGFFGGYHARAIARVKGARLAAVCADGQALADAFAAEHGGKPYGDWRHLIDDRSVDAVAITAPHHLHSALAIAAVAWKGDVGASTVAWAADPLAAYDRGTW